MPEYTDVNYYDQPLFRSFRITDDQMRSEEFLRIYGQYRSIFDRHDNTLRIDRPLAVQIVQLYEAGKTAKKPKPKAEAKAKDEKPADPPRKPRGRPPKAKPEAPEGVPIVSSVN